MSSSVLVVIGSGPGIGLATASLFAVRKFDKIALISRNSARLSKDQAVVLQAARAAGRDVEVSTFSQDVGETESFQRTLKKVEELGQISCILFNSARVEPSDLLTYDEKEVVADFLTTNIGILTTARWAIPLLSKATDKPAFLVTGGMLWETPKPDFFSLSMVKTSQRNLVRSLAMTFSDVHIALVNVGGIVSPEDKIFNPTAVAEKFWDVYSEGKGQWTSEVNILAA